jgi:2,4-dienoyl-CoA reductase-like NADH-dependent reductase (Old Yellow Enzyme family)
VGRISHPDAPEQIKAGVVCFPDFLMFAHVADCETSRSTHHLPSPPEAESSASFPDPLDMSRYDPLSSFSTRFSTYIYQPTEIDDPTVLIAQYKQAAINAKEAGFDGVERTPI